MRGVGEGVERGKILPLLEENETSVTMKLDARKGEKKGSSLVLSTFLK